MRIENSFIPVRGVGEQTERKLWRSGVTHWDDFDGSVVGPTTADRIEAFIDEARDRLAREDTRFFGEAFPTQESWRLYENFRDRTCFFDIETTGLSKERDRVTTVSFHQGDETTTLVQGDDLTAETLSEQFEDAALMATFNGARFDVPFLETSFDVDLDLPHIDLMYPCKRIGLDGGLKTIEKDVGIARDGPDISGRDAVRLWNEYERGSQEALDTLVEYNRDDTRNLQTLMDIVADSLHADVFEAEQ
ncbi:ribonuclease H-like domain-containing protein [Haloarchaeobius sp. DYHT-AS-18]|uniref:ribonuclease H-like domain-containing protein n=1 Tax=Haloarchaeobius sp. DYHT-AS-18 TaxID=3446117 RepID=UPI003EB83FE7